MTPFYPSLTLLDDDHGDNDYGSMPSLLLVIMNQNNTMDQHWHWHCHHRRRCRPPYPSQCHYQFQQKQQRQMTHPLLLTTCRRRHRHHLALIILPMSVGPYRKVSLILSNMNKKNEKDPKGQKHQLPEIEKKQ